MRAALLVLACCLSACSAVPVPSGPWRGDAFLPGGTERMELVTDSTGTSLRITLRGWQLDTVRLARVRADGDQLAFRGVVGSDTLQLAGVMSDGRWEGRVAKGGDTARFEVRHGYNPIGAEWHAMLGTYRASDGRLFGIAPLTEFGPHPMLVDYGSGRLAPLYPLSDVRMLVGAALVSPVFPVDTLDLIPGPGGAMEAIRYSQAGRAVIAARRLATRDVAVQFMNGAIRLAGTLTLPEGPPPFPAMVLVHGSNALTRDVFGPWVRFFAAQGFAVLAYDKRGTGGSGGDWKNADLPTLAGDVLSAVHFLESRPGIRTDRIGLWGISQAGWIMPMVAAQAPKDIAFMIVHSGTGTTVREQGNLNLRSELRASGLPDSSVELGLRYHFLDDEVSRTGKGLEEVQKFYDEHDAGAPFLWEPAPLDSWFRSYYAMLMDFDPRPYWEKVKCPVLLLFGEVDANVPPAESWPPIEAALRKAGNTHVTQVVFPHANHLLLEAKTGGRAEYPGLSRFVPGYFDRMAEWLATEVR